MRSLAGYIVCKKIRRRKTINAFVLCDANHPNYITCYRFIYDYNDNTFLYLHRTRYKNSWYGKNLCNLGMSFGIQRIHGSFPWLGEKAYQILYSFRRMLLVAKYTDKLHLKVWFEGQTKAVQVY